MQQILNEMKKSPAVNRCDFGYVYDGAGVGFLNNNAQIQEIPRYILHLKNNINIFSKQQYPRAVMSMRVFPNQSQQMLRSFSHCLVHFVDLSDTELSVKYIKSAWSNKALGSNHVYAINLREGEEALQKLNFVEIFDFQRMFVYYPSTVSIQLHSKYAETVKLNITFIPLETNC
jgi:hypothetical protein